jgi:hypothetical protein
MIADCYVNHLSGMTNATWNANQNNSASDSAISEVNAADRQCQKALPALANLVDFMN